MDYTHPTPRPFRVIVVGAGIVGLSLSHALQRANIDHVVLEKYDQVVPLRGASLVILPNGARVLDQFGILSKIHQSISPTTAEYKRWTDGSRNPQGSIMMTLNAMFGLPSVVFGRHNCASLLYENLPDKSLVQTRKQVERIEHTKEGVRVHLSDGTVEEGDMVVGADGVHSTVRTQMWNYANSCLPNLIPESDKSPWLSEYNAVFGVSTPSYEQGFSEAEINVTHGPGVVRYLFTQPGVIYWLLVFKNKPNQTSEKSTAAQALEAIAHEYKDSNFTEKVKLGDLWATRTRAALVNLEEGILSQWHAGRIVLMGDAAHKMTADLGLGANVGIEDAASLCNMLHRELAATRTGRPDAHALSSIFAEFQAARYERVKAFVDLSGKATRMHTYDSLFGRVFVGYIAPWLVKYQVLMLARALVKAPKLDFVPVITINEEAEGWKLAEGTRGSSFVVWLVCAAIGVVMAYVMLSRGGLDW